jgi:hypothetical protein
MMHPHFKTTLIAARTPPKKNHVSGGWKVVQPLVYWSAHAGLITVPAGFETDFASVPRLPLMFLFFGDRVHAAAVIHDFLCVTEFRQRKMTWSDAAHVFGEAMHAQGAPWWQRAAMVAAVKLFGRLAHHHNY